MSSSRFHSVQRKRPSMQDNNLSFQVLENMQQDRLQLLTPFQKKTANNINFNQEGQFVPRAERAGSGIQSHISQFSAGTPSLFAT